MCMRRFVCRGILGLGLLTIGIATAALSCQTEAPGSGQTAPGTLEISFLFNKAEGVVPSYQIAIWLENREGQYIKTLFVSEYLAGPGIGLEVVCPEWVRQAHWDKVEESEFDAATHPTPPIGANTLKFNCKERRIARGSYRFCVQAHISENYNILYRGLIVLGQEASEGTTEVYYSPKKHPLASEILYNVRARYEPGEEINPSTKKEKP